MKGAVEESYALTDRDPENIGYEQNYYDLLERPFDQHTPERLLHDAERLANEKGLGDILELLKKAAPLAKDPRAFEAVKGLTPTERQYLRLERTHRFKQPFTLYLSIVICSVGAAVQGWDQTGSNSANLNWPEAFGLDPDHNNHDNWLLGLVNAAPYLAAALCGCWLADPLNHFWGRRGAIFFAAIFCFISVIGSAFTQTWQQLFICRILLGIGVGAKASTVPVLSAENSPASIRGTLVMGWQLWVAFGIFIGFTANLAVYNVGPIAWRLQLGSAFIPTVPLLIGIWFIPESPRWLIKKNKYRAAYTSLRRLRNTPLQAARDLYYIHAKVTIEKKIILSDRRLGNARFAERDLINVTNYFKRFVQLFTIPRNRRSTLAAFVVMIAQQMCGINIMAFYSSTVFVAALGNSSDPQTTTRTALLASWGFGLINFTFAWPAMRNIDTFGRRALLLFTFPHMAWTLLAAGFCFYIPQSSNAHVGLIALFVYIFAAFYSPGEGPVPFTYSAEVFPLYHREVGMSFAVSINLFFAGVLTVVFPQLLAAFGPTGAFAFFAGLNVVALIMIFLWVPETKQRTLEELDKIFSIPTREFMHYQTFRYLPWAFRRKILRQDVHLKKLYDFDVADNS